MHPYCAYRGLPIGVGSAGSINCTTSASAETRTGVSATSVVLIRFSFPSEITTRTTSQLPTSLELNSNPTINLIIHQTRQKEDPAEFDPTTNVGAREYPVKTM